MKKSNNLIYSGFYNVHEVFKSLIYNIHKQSKLINYNNLYKYTKSLFFRNFIVSVSECIMWVF